MQILRFPSLLSENLWGCSPRICIFLKYTLKFEKCDLRELQTSLPIPTNHLSSSTLSRYHFNGNWKSSSYFEMTRSQFSAFGISDSFKLEDSEIVLRKCIFHRMLTTRVCMFIWSKLYSSKACLWANKALWTQFCGL